MEFIDYYKILGLTKDASEQDIKKAYRKLARKYHPDLRPDDADAQKNFQQINDANEVLSDPEKRKKYDLYGENWRHADEIEKAQSEQKFRAGGFGQGSFGAGGQGFSAGDTESFFEALFGRRPDSHGRPAVFRGRDIHATLQVMLSQVQKSDKQTFEIGGKKIRITVPAGIEDGQVIKLKELGEAGNSGGPNGDLYITFHVVNDTNFKRDGETLFKEVSIDLLSAVLGGSVEVDTLQGKVKLQIKPGTQSGTKVRLKGRGFPRYKRENEHGDLVVNLIVEIPVTLSAKEKELYHELLKERQHAAA
jgi:curved DNA-binding protein